MAVKIAGKSNKQLREERAALVQSAQQFHSDHADDWTADRQAQFDAMMEDASSYASAIKRGEQLRELTSFAGTDSPEIDPNDRPGRSAQTSQDATVEYRVFGQPGTPKYEARKAGVRGQADYRKAFVDYLRSGERQAALQSDDSEQAGYLLAPEQFAAGILKEVDDLLFIRRYARVHTVPEANSLGIRKRTARMSTFGFTSELEVAAEDASLKYGKKILTPHHLTGMIKVSRDLMRRSSDIEAEVRYELARDAGEVMEDHYLTGTGDRQPLGLFTASADGISTARDVVTGANDNFTADQLLVSKYTLKGQYRRGLRGEVRWLFHRDAISKIARLKDSEGQYLLRVGMGVMQDGGAPEDTLLGFPVDESERVPSTFSAGNYVGMLGNYRFYEIADALDFELQVLNELYAANNQVGMIARLKTDGMPTLEEAFVRLKCGT